jgi:Ser/Thr protein kinase RdoA (MazF antagonist)
MTGVLGPLIATGNVAEVYAWGGGRVLKLFKPGVWTKRTAFREAANQATAEAFELPVPTVHGVIAHDGRWGVISDRVEGSSFAERMLADPREVPAHLAALVYLQLRVQETAAPFFSGLKQRLASHIDRAPQLGAARKRALLEGLRAMPDGDRLCHFDFHPMNVLGPVDNPTVIDWCDACRGAAPADACRSYVLLEIHATPLAAPYLERYCAVAGCTADEVLAWRPYVLGAMVLETPDEAPRLLALLAEMGW